jgi:DNA-binding transcriptional LysR family regulator
MAEYKKPGTAREYDMQEGLALAVSYLEDPSAVPCPRCGPGTMEVVCYLDARCMEQGNVVPAAPRDDYTVVLYCHGCGRAAALDLSRDVSGRGEGEERRDAA